jgi:hypothetical protein
VIRTLQLRGTEMQTLPLGGAATRMVSFAAMPFLFFYAFGI